MSFSIRIRGAAAAFATALVVASTPSAMAQDIAASHLQAAREAVTSVRATDAMDAILFQAAQLLKIELVNKDPNLDLDIDRIVNENALELAVRRGDLEREVALVYARIFSEDELKQIAAFHASPAGQKFIEQNPIVNRQVNEAVDIWQRGIARDLAQGVAKELAELAPIDPTAGPLQLTEPKAQ